MGIFLWLLNLIKRTHLTIYQIEHQVKLEKIFTTLVKTQLQNDFFANNIIINMITIFLKSLIMSNFTKIKIKLYICIFNNLKSTLIGGY